MAEFPEFVRNVAVVGHLHHGKTALMDMLVFETHKLVWDSDHQVRLIFDAFYFFLTQYHLFRRAIPTRMYYRANAKFPSSLRQCH